MVLTEVNYIKPCTYGNKRLMKDLPPGMEKESAQQF